MIRTFKQKKTQHESFSVMGHKLKSLINKAIYILFHIVNEMSLLRDLMYLYLLQCAIIYMGLIRVLLAPREQNILMFLLFPTS